MIQSNTTPSTAPNEEDLSKAESRLDDAEDRLDDAEDRLDAVESCNVEARLEAIERRLAGEIALRLDWLERDVRSLRDDVYSHIGPPRPEGR